MQALKKPIGITVAVILLIMCLISWYWSREPDLIDLPTASEAPVVGVATASMLIKSVDVLLDKPGGYLSNDKMPPSVFLDNMPNWEFGVLQQVRDLAKALRNDFSRSQTQSLADKDLEEAEPKFNVNSFAWLFPSAEGEYKDGREGLQNYLDSLQDTSKQNAQFYARADNLNEWLSLVEKRLGSLSQRLSAAKPQVRVNTDLAGDKNAEQSTQASPQVVTKTSWFEIDDNFFEARGTAWALIHYLRAAEIDFREVLIDKNALVSLQQIIRELEATQQPIRSLMILNGSGLGMFANHSLVMSSYITRANAAISDLRTLLADG